MQLKMLISVLTEACFSAPN